MVKTKIKVRAHLKYIRTKRGKKRRLIRAHSRVVTKVRVPSPSNFEQKIRGRTELILMGSDTLLPGTARKMAIDELKELGHIPRRSNFGAQPRVREISEITREIDEKRASKFVRDILKQGRQRKPTEPGILIDEQDIGLAKRQLLKQTIKQTQESNRIAGNKLRRKLGLLPEAPGSEEE